MWVKRLGPYIFRVNNFYPKDYLILRKKSLNKLLQVIQCAYKALLHFWVLSPLKFRISLASLYWDANESVFVFSLPHIVELDPLTIRTGIKVRSKVRCKYEFKAVHIVSETHISSCKLTVYFLRVGTTSFHSKSASFVSHPLRRGVNIGAANSHTLGAAVAAGGSCCSSILAIVVYSTIRIKLLLSSVCSPQQITRDVT
jgi:hypothetical protein